MDAFILGFGIGLSLILAIGAQNAFVLKQGIKKQYVFLVCIICAVSDAVFIFAGVMGFGYLVYKFSYLKYIARYGGAAFLLFYAIKSLSAAYTIEPCANPKRACHAIFG